MDLAESNRGAALASPAIGICGGVIKLRTNWCGELLCIVYDGNQLIHPVTAARPGIDARCRDRSRVGSGQVLRQMQFSLRVFNIQPEHQQTDAEVAFHYRRASAIPSRTNQSSAPLLLYQVKIK